MQNDCIKTFLRNEAARKWRYLKAAFASFRLPSLAHAKIG